MFSSQTYETTLHAIDYAKAKPAQAAAYVAATGLAVSTLPLSGTAAVVSGP